MQHRHFTLVEIMIVVAIIGLLAAIAIPSFMTARTNARKSMCINNLRQIDGAKEQWAMGNNADVGNTAVTLALLVGTGGFIKETPQCPAGGAYTVSAIGTAPGCNIAGHGLP